MAAKLLHSLADENPDLQKQIGCMTGIFQLFDRHQMIAGRRISHKRLPPPGTSQFNRINAGRDHTVYNRQAADEISLYKSVNEKQRVSTESSRVSVSSSCSSSSLECSKAAQPEPSCLDRIIFPVMPSRDPVINQPSVASTSVNISRHSAELKDVVKDSMNREVWGLSVKTSSKEEALAHALKNKDSPRPLPLDASHNIPADLQESLRVLAKLQEAPWNFQGTRERPGPRFSCDGREVNRLSFESRDAIKASTKLKDLPRLSLDSREGSFPRNNGSTDVTVENLPRASVTQSRPTSVVAKLMGLEALPNSAISTSSHMSGGSGEEADSSIRTLKTKELLLPIRGFNPSLRGSLKEPVSPRWKGHEKVMKPISRFPNEPAPWKQVEGNRNLHNKPLKVFEIPSSSPSVYGEIEKRQKDLEFKQSGKDLRALKQILEAIQAKGLLEITTEDLSSNFERHKCFEPRGTTPGKNTRLETRRNRMRDTGSRAFESPIVIMKPAKLVQKYGLEPPLVVPEDLLSTDARKGLARTQMAKNQTPKTDHVDKRSHDRTMKSSQSPSKPYKTLKESSTSSVKSSGSISPRLQQKKLEIERRSRPPTPTDSNKPRKQPSRRVTSDSTSPGGRLRSKYPVHRPSDDQLSEASNESRALSCHADDLSVHSDGNNRSDCNPMLKNSILRSSEEDELSAELSVGPAEHRSPVSVLDVSEYTEDASSPLKEELCPLKDQVITQDSFPEYSFTTSPISEINRKKLQNIDQLVQKLRRLNSQHDEERTDYIASLCENTNPDHRYISEMLVASGLLLRDLSCNSVQFQLHSSNHPINPELFFVLEQTKAGAAKVPAPKQDKERARRRLMFDSVNEILVEKLSDSGYITDPQPGHGKLARKALTAQKLLKELCLEIELLENKKPECLLVTEEDDPLKGIIWEEVMNRRTGSWNDFHGETSGLVLDIERSIFKDLVNEVLIGESTGLRARPSRRRQLFAK